MERMVNQVSGLLLHAWTSTTPTDYLWVAGVVLFVGWMISRSTQPRYS